MTLYEELTSLIRLFQDVTDDYQENLRAGGDENLSNEWRWNVGDLLDDAWHLGKALAETYAAPPEEIPGAMREFVLQGLVQPEIHTRGLITRLKDVLEGKPPSWPEGDGGPLSQADLEEFNRMFTPSTGLASLNVELWGVLWKFRHATEGYVYLLRAAGMGKLADEWKDAIWKLTWEVWAGGGSLANVYLATPEKIPDAMRRFFQRSQREAEANCRGPMARLKDAVK